jgi:hypothetical protein
MGDPTTDKHVYKNFFFINHKIDLHYLFNKRWEKFVCVHENKEGNLSEGFSLVNNTFLYKFLCIITVTFFTISITFFLSFTKI